MDFTEKKLLLDGNDLASILSHNIEMMELIENKFQSTLTLRGNLLIIKGSQTEIKMIETLVGELNYILKRNGTFEINDVSKVLDLLSPDKTIQLHNISDNGKVIYQGVRDTIKARNNKQQDYYKKVSENDMVFAIGPAGTGKTFLAVAMALSALKRNEVTKIILSRPAVEAGESLGYLPGDLKEKLDPYLRPLTDALFIMLNADKLKNYMEKNIIEIIPLAYMRGRTLSNSFIILDEAQNSTIAQMKMFLTRLGDNSKAIITGDVTQIDLQNKNNSGLINADKVLQNIKGIDFVYFDNQDVVRHHLVTEIIKAYEREAEMLENIKRVKSQTNIQNKDKSEND